MSSIASTMLLASLAWVIGFGVLAYAVHARWFGRFSHGFFFTLVAGMTGIAMMGATVIGLWGYLAAKRVVQDEVLVELQDVGGIVEAEVTSIVQDTIRQMEGLSDSIATAMGQREGLPALRDQLETVRSLESHYLQIRLLDADGKDVLTVGAAQTPEPQNRVGIAFALEGKTFVSEVYMSEVFHRQVIQVISPIRKRAGGSVLGAIGIRYDIQTELANLVGKAKFNESGYAVVVDSEGQVVAHPEPSRINADLSEYAAVKLARSTGKSGEVVARNLDGEERLFVYRPIPSPATLARQPWVLLTEIKESELTAIFRSLQRELALGVLLLIVLSVVVAHVLADSIRRPLYEIRDFTRRVKAGDLTGRLAITGQDVAGALATSLNEMVGGLNERDRVKEVFGRYIATQVSDKILSGQVNLGGEARQVTVLFSDIRSFTSMSEAMTPQQVVAFLNDYFSEMVEAVFEQGGVLDKFLGDGLMAVFGSMGDQPDHARRAVLAALRMKALLAKINGTRSVEGLPPIAIGVGIHTAEVIVGNIGSRKRLEYTVIGDGVNTSSRVQTLNKEFGTTILITESTYASIGDEFECREMPESHLRGKTKVLKIYEVVSAKRA